MAVGGTVLDTHGTDSILILLGIPTACTQIHIALKEIECGVNGLLLDAEKPPFFDEGVSVSINRLQQRGGLTLHEVLVRLQQPLLVFNLHFQAVVHLLRCCAAARPPISIDTKRVANLVDLLAHSRHGRSYAMILEVDHENRFVHFSTSLWVPHRLEDLLKMGEGVASGRSEEHSSKSILLLLVDNSSNVAEHCLKTSSGGASLLVQQRPGSFELETVLRRSH
mmetsp:Transcript_2232/g.5181  ORF Transcript_2232/g.5181 Transcript_2232/m.5181 type:complete len:223 (+) Transcript_2232:1484-2152(+)